MNPMTIIVVGAAGIAAGIYLVDREGMKTRDEEIAEHRQRERAEEAIRNQNGQPKEETLQHISHNHPLSEVYLPSSLYGTCGVCLQQVTAAWAYHCSPCKYYVHQVCAKDLVSLSPCAYTRAREIQGPMDATTILTFAHQGHHVRELYSNEEYKCRHCFTPGFGNRFSCDGCQVNLHPVYAFNPTKISSFMHPQHDLKLKTRAHFSVCAICDTNDTKIESSIRMYRCKPCKFYVHPTCSQLPQHLMHDLHPPHPLQLRRAELSRKCNAYCSSSCDEGKWCYECKICSVSIHIKCVLQHSAHDTSSKDKDINEIIQVLNLVIKVVEISNVVVSIVDNGKCFINLLRR